MKTVLCVFLFLVTWVPLTWVPAWAALGQTEDSVQADARALNGNTNTRAMSGYTIHQVTKPDGSVLREFVSPQGLVFGVAWQGPTMPNLPLLLGSSFSDFQEGSKNDTTRGVRHRGPLSIRQNHLVLQTGGHLRAFHLRAYLANLLPKGVSEEVVQ